MADQQEMSDEDVLGKQPQHEMNDADVFGKPEPAPEPLSMKGFKQRLADVWEKSKIDADTAMASSPELRMGAHINENIVPAFKKGFEEGRGGWETLGLSDDQKDQLNDLLGNAPPKLKALAIGGAQGTAILFRGLSGLYRGAQEAAVAAGVPKEIAQMPDAFMGSPHPTGIPKPTEAATISRVVADRDGNMRVQHIGELPTPADFKGGAEVLSRPDHVAELEARQQPPQAAPTLVEENLHKLWDERGIHPAEVVHDAQSDALLRQEVAPPSVDGWHGSPHEFDEFSTEKIGEGQGAQVFGHGIYIAEHPDVAQGYRFHGKAADLDLPFAERHASFFLRKHMGDRAAAIREVEDNIRVGIEDRLPDDEVAQDRKALDVLNSDWQPPHDVLGSLYRVRILADRDHMVDWFKSLHEQSPFVLQAFERLRDAIKDEKPMAQSGLMLDGLLGDRNKAIQKALDALKGAGATAKEVSPLQFEDFYRQFAKYDFDEISAADMMRDAGIPGIKYFDEGSRPQTGFSIRKTGGGWEAIDMISGKYGGPFKTQEEALSWREAQRTYNFVIFDDKLLQITEKNGVPFKPTKTAPVQNTPMPRGTPRSELARTGEPHIDAILDDPVTKRNIDEAVINDQYDVPYSAGGSTPMHDPTMYIDRHFPRSMEVDGVRFDPAEPFTIHENVEQHVMEALIKGGMDHEMAYRVAHFEFAEKAEGAWYRAHGIDQARAEAAYRPYVDAIQHENPANPPPNLYADPYPHDDVRAAQGEPLAEPSPSKAEIAQAKAILAGEPKPAPGGADVTRDMPDTPLSVEPPSPPGRSAGAAGTALDQLNGFAKNLQFLLDPMATGSNRAMVIAKDAISMVRRIRWDHLRIDRDLVKRFEPEQRKRMWDAADEESVALQLGESREHQGLVTLEPEERALVEELQARSQSAWLLTRDAGIVEGDGLPAYTPRMVLNVASATDALGPRALNELGRNVFTRTAQLKRRGHMTAEETEAAAKELVGRRMAERGASMAEITAAQEKVTIARDIRALALATARLEEASVWRTMINEIEMAGKSAGEPTVAVGFKPNNEWFTVAGHPAFTRWEPLLEKVQDVAGKPYWQPVLNSAGEPIFQQKPIYMHNEFKGPMTAILDPGETQSKLVQGAESGYGALMALKGKSMTVILNSPLIHNAVVWSKVAEAAGLREWMGFGLYWRGNRIVSNPGRAGELIERGLQPMGPRGSFQDISSMMEHPDITQAQHPSWTGKILAAVPGLFDEAAGAKVESAIAKAGDFVHNTLLWDRVRDVQFGLADFLSDRLVAKGNDRLTADRIAAHFSNMVVGSIPKEAMSAAARGTANVFMFSRSFTLGNLAVYKQAVMGLPKPILAQIERDFGIRVPEGTAPEDMAAALAGVKKDAQSIARRKAAGTLALSAAFFYVGNAVIQHAFNVLSRDATADEESQAYARRFAELMADTSEDPFELRHMIGRLSPTYDNEPSKEDRVHIGYAKDGTAIYGRSPLGKYGEEVIGFPTKPMTMVRQKLNPTISGLLEVFENDKGFGRKIYDENDKSLGGDVNTAFAVAKHLIMKHLPEQQITGAVDLLRGDGDTKVNAYRAFGPVIGFTASVGAPGGQARGEQLAAKQQFDARFNLAWPDIRKQVLRGDSDGAREALTGLGVPPRMQEGLIRNALNPSGALRGGTLRNFYQYSTPQQRERFERAQGRSGAPVPPEMPQLEMPQ